MKLRVLSLAENDIWNGYRFYERQVSGLGHAFMSEAFASIEGLLQTHGVHRRMHGFHRLLMRRFPFAIFYRIVGEEIQIWRIFDCRRDPDWVTRELHR